VKLESQLGCKAAKRYGAPLQVGFPNQWIHYYLKTEIMASSLVVYVYYLGRMTISSSSTISTYCSQHQKESKLPVDSSSPRLKHASAIREADSIESAARLQGPRVHSSPSPRLHSPNPPNPPYLLIPGSFRSSSFPIFYFLLEPSVKAS
jgi:hypothetical protein